MDDQARQLPMIEPPRGMFPGKLDEKGRLKLPEVFKRYFDALREKQFFVTSLDRRIVRIYPLDAWRRNENFFESFHDDPKTAKRVAFNAADLGAEADMDNQGRITIHPDLRRELGMENAPVRLFAYKGRLEILSEKVYEERRQDGGQTTEEDINKLEIAGMN